MVAADRTSPVGHPPAGFPAPPLVLDLKEAGSAPPGLVGGKALNLGRLLAAGFTVPPGFCLTTKAYELAAPARLGAIAAELDAEIDGAAPPSAAVRPFARHARDLLAAAPVPPDVAAALRTAYAALGDAPGDEPAVAVRSSATAEDLPFASFAGQQDSYLNVVGAEAVIDSVRQCWASLWSERAVAYRSANRISHHDVGLAVVVQRYVEAATAGVLFTANPVTGTRTETVIDASPGPGQAVVSGAVNPDHFVLDTATAWVQLRAPGGAEPGRPPSLSDAQLSRLTASGDAVQRLFGTPQDIEWLIDVPGRLWLTQSRPITTLYPLEDPTSSDPAAMASEAGGTRVYLCGTLLQGLTRPITPLGLAVLGGMRNGKGPWTYVNPGLRMYIDLTPALRSRFGRRYLLRFLPLADGRSARLIPALLDDPRFRLIRRSRKFPAKTKPAAKASPGQSTTDTAGLRRMLTLLPALLRAAFRPGAELRRAKEYGQRLEAELALPAPATAFQRLDYAEHSMDRMVDGLIEATLPGPAVGYIMLAGARRLLRGIAQPRELEAVLRGLPHNVTTEMDLKLWDLAVAVGRDPASRGEFLRHSPQELARRYRADTAPVPCPRRRRPASGPSSRSTATAPWRRSIPACRGGPRNRTISSA